MFAASGNLKSHSSGVGEDATICTEPTHFARPTAGARNGASEWATASLRGPSKESLSEAPKWKKANPPALVCCCWPARAEQKQWGAPSGLILSQPANPERPQKVWRRAIDARRFEFSSRFDALGRARSLARSHCSGGACLCHEAGEPPTRWKRDGPLYGRPWLHSGARFLSPVCPHWLAAAEMSRRCSICAVEMREAAYAPAKSRPRNWRAN